MSLEDKIKEVQRQSKPLDFSNRTFDDQADVNSPSVRDQRRMSFAPGLVSVKSPVFEAENDSPGRTLWLKLF